MVSQSLKPLGNQYSGHGGQVLTESIPLAPLATALLWRLEMEDKDGLEGVARLSLSPWLVAKGVFSDLSNILASKQHL